MKKVSPPFLDRISDRAYVSVPQGEVSSISASEQDSILMRIIEESPVAYIVETDDNSPLSRRKKGFKPNSTDVAQETTQILYVEPQVKEKFLQDVSSLTGKLRDSLLADVMLTDTAFQMAMQEVEEYMANIMGADNVLSISWKWYLDIVEQGLTLKFVDLVIDTLELSESGARAMIAEHGTRKRGRQESKSRSLEKLLHLLKGK